MMATGMIHHFEINVSNLQRSIAFWGWLLKELGYESFQEWESGKSWKLGETYLVFVQTDVKFIEPGYHRRRTGLNHIAFHGRSREQVNQLTERLMSKNVPILYKDKHPYAGGEHHYAVFFEDPDRIKVEIVAPINNSYA